MWQRARTLRPFRSLLKPLHQRNKLSSFTRIYISRPDRSGQVRTGHHLSCYLEVAHRSEVNKGRVQNTKAEVAPGQITITLGGIVETTKATSGFN